MRYYLFFSVLMLATAALFVPVARRCAKATAGGMSRRGLLMVSVSLDLGRRALFS
jgi:hypothetical protein